MVAEIVGSGHSSLGQSKRLLWPKDGPQQRPLWPNILYYNIHQFHFALYYIIIKSEEINYHVIELNVINIAVTVPKPFIFIYQSAIFAQFLK